MISNEFIYNIWHTRLSITGTPVVLIKDGWYIKIFINQGPNTLQNYTNILKTHTPLCWYPIRNDEFYIDTLDRLL